MRSRLALGFVLVALAALAWQLVRARRNDASLGVRAVPADSLPRETQDAQGERELGAAGNAPSVDRRANTGEVRFEPLPDAKSELLVHVADEYSHEPIAGAEVYALDVQDGTWMETAGPDGGPVVDLESELKARGRHLQSDADGNLRLPLPSGWVVVCARKEQSFGGSCFSFDDAPECTLELRPCHPCRVRVIDPEARPLPDVPIVIGGREEDPAWRGFTNSSGETSIPNVEWLWSRLGYSETDYFVGAEVSSGTPVAHWFHCGHPLPELIELTVPGTASLRLRILAADGTRVPLRGRIKLFSWDPERKTLRSRAIPSSPILEGVAQFAHVDTRLWLQPDVLLEGGVEFSEELRVEPSDLQRDLELRVRERTQVLLAHLVDTSGSVLSHQELTWLCSVRSQAGAWLGDYDPSALHTDEQGLCAIAVSREDLPTVDLDGQLDPEPPNVLSGRISLHRAGEWLASDPIECAKLGTGPVHDLGRIQLLPRKPIVHGRVLDDRGQPIDHPTFELQQPLATRPDQMLNLEVKAVQHDRGGFELFGECPGGRVRMSVSRKGFCAREPALEFDCGTDPDLQVRLERVGAARTSVLVDPEVAQELTWEIGEGDHPRQVSFDAQFGPLITREIADLEPGVHRIRLLASHPEGQELLSIPDLVVRPGEITIDPRLQDIDLRGRLASDSRYREVSGLEHLMQLRVVDAQGAPCHEGQLLMGADAGQEWHGDGPSLARSAIGTRIALWSPGRGTWIGECPAVETEIRLEPPLRVRLHVELPSFLLQSGLRLSIRASPANGDELVQRLAWGDCTSDLDEKGSCRFTCPVPGAWKILLDAIRFDANGRPDYDSSPVLEVHSPLTIAAQQGEQSFELAVTPEEWKALAKGLSGQR
jgi:hypothetical protein